MAGPTCAAPYLREEAQYPLVGILVSTCRSRFYVIVVVVAFKVSISEKSLGGRWWKCLLMKQAKEMHSSIMR